MIRRFGARDERSFETFDEENESFLIASNVERLVCERVRGALDPRVRFLFPVLLVRRFASDEKRLRFDREKEKEDVVRAFQGRAFASKRDREDVREDAFHRRSETYVMSDAWPDDCVFQAQDEMHHS